MTKYTQKYQGQIPDYHQGAGECAPRTLDIDAKRKFRPLFFRADIFGERETWVRTGRVGVMTEAFGRRAGEQKRVAEYECFELRLIAKSMWTDVEGNVQENFSYVEDGE